MGKNLWNPKFHIAVFILGNPAIIDKDLYPYLVPGDSYSSERWKLQLHSSCLVDKVGGKPARSDYLYNN